ncbi:glucosyltransferase domain-containing protein [Pseudomonas citronellolis]|uniref:Glucosyltransferase domain-containing protein n=1 Tax=Pseudomonas citronellolis TaxID=53408 RepID=A0AAW6P525_9PSED|nr:glucosyltransferase domain-containing protein [Pseudomonas citronellolis]MDF3842311.1 glucosyltransferase domain-containing protein [Pseudomonas citronellolis]
MINKKYLYFVWSRDDMRLFALIFFFSIIAKGAAAFRGVSIDDYPFSLGVSDKQLELFLTQGRFLGWLTAYVIDAIGVNLNDTYFASALLVIALQAALVVSVMRFVGYSSLISAGIIGGLISLYPYSAELLTFKVILPIYALALVFTIIAIESAREGSKGFGVKVVAMLSIAAALMTYQASLNYLLVAAYGCLLMSVIFKRKDTESELEYHAMRSRGWWLLLFSFLGAALFLATLSLVKHLGLVGDVTARAKFIGINQLSKRVEEVSSALYIIFLKSEPIFPIGLKAVFMIITLTAILLVLANLLRGFRNYWNLVFGLFLLSLIPLLSIGIIIPFNDWWPVPRVLAHVSLLFGLLFLAAEKTISQGACNLIGRFFMVGGSLILLGFVFINNQVFADQQKIAQWDRFKVNRIVGRLEGMPDFKDIERLYVNGGGWGYPIGLRTLQGDMNISAFSAEWSKVPLVLESTGYNFGRPSATDIKIGTELCAERSPWPDKDSVFVRGELAVVCLER